MLTALQLRDGAQLLDDFGNCLDEQTAKMVAFAARRMLPPNHLPVFFATQTQALAGYLQSDFVIWITEPAGLLDVTTHRRFHLLANPNSRGARSPTVSVSLDASSRDVIPVPRFNDSIRGGGEPLLPLLRGLGQWPLKAARASVLCNDATAFVSKRTQLAFSGSVEKHFIELPITDIDRLLSWRLGCIVGPSGSGKSVTLRRLPRVCQAPPPGWDRGAVIDALVGDAEMRRKRLRAAGLSKAQWSRPYATLSAGEQAAARLAHDLTPFDDNRRCVVAVDEAFSFHDPLSALDSAHKLMAFLLEPGRRTQLVLAGAAIDERLLAVLQPCFIFNPSKEPSASDAVRIFRQPRDPPQDRLAAARAAEPPPLLASLFRRYALAGTIRKSKEWRAAWDLVKHHHYLSHVFPSSATQHVYILRCNGTHELIGFIAFGAHCGRPSSTDARKLWLERRLVVLPSWQGMRIGPTLSETIAAHVTAGHLQRPPIPARYSSVTANAALGAQRSALGSPWHANANNGKLSSGGAHGAKDKAKYVQFSHEFIGSRAGAAAGGAPAFHPARASVPRPPSAAAAGGGPPPASGGDPSRKRPREPMGLLEQLQYNSRQRMDGSGSAADAPAALAAAAPAGRAAAAPAARAAAAPAPHAAAAAPAARAADTPAARAGAAAEARAAAAVVARAAAAAAAAPEAVTIGGCDGVEVLVIDDDDDEAVELVSEDDDADYDCIVLD